VLVTGVVSGFPDNWFDLHPTAPLCFVAGTPVSIPQGYRAIEDIRVGDVVSVKTAEGIVRARVSNLVTGVKPQLVKIDTSDGQTFQCTPDHPWQLADGNFVFASNLCAGDQLNSDHGEVYVLDTNLRIGEFTVYTFGVNHPDHTYMVGGLVVHNKTGAAGSAGWQTVPPGYPNDSFPLWIQSGEKYQVIPNGMNPSGGGSGTVNNESKVINIYNPTFNVTSGGIVDVLEALR
jgi:hypothetical protein